MVNYEHYKIFRKIVECESISKAASQLYVSQPAISHALKQLEANLNVKLFFRTQRGVNLTTEGAILYEYVRQGCAIIEAGEKKLEELNALQAGEVKIGASDMTLKFFLLPFIEKFHKNFPLVKIKVTNSPTPKTLQYLKEGVIDFGAVSEPVDLSNENFNFTSVKSVKDILIAGQAFKDKIIKDDRQMSPKDLHKYPFVLLEKGTSTRLHIENYFKTNNAEIQPEIELASNELLIEFIKRGIGIGFVPEDFVKKELKNGELFKIDLNPELAPRQFYIVTHSYISLPSAAKKLLEFNDVHVGTGEVTSDVDLYFDDKDV